MKLCLLNYHGLCRQIEYKKQVDQSIPSLIPIPWNKLVNKRNWVVFCILLRSIKQIFTQETNTHDMNLWVLPHPLVLIVSVFPMWGALKLSQERWQGCLIIFFCGLCHVAHPWISLFSPFFPLTAAEAKVQCSPKELSSHFSMAERERELHTPVADRMCSLKHGQPPLNGSV